MNTDLNDSATTNLLLKRSVSGDEDAFARLFRRYERALRGMVSRRIEAGLTRRFDASDVIQETRLEAFRRLSEFVKRRPMPLALWLQRTALQQLTNMRRFHVDAAKRSVRQETEGFERSSTLLSQSLIASKITPSAIVSAEEETRIVRRALDDLDASDREILLLRYVEQFSNQEIAYLLNISDPVASRRHGMALLRLRRVLQQYVSERK